MIQVEHLTKCYDKFVAVDDLSFTIEDGHIYGFLGPNGAGKSTTMNIMTGCLSMTSGKVTIDNYDILEEPIEAKQKIGYLPEIPPLYFDMTPNEYLLFVAKAKKIKKTDLNQQIAYVKEKTKIDDVSNKLIKQLSKGYRQRVGIAQALLGNPEVIILDEPTVGLDPNQIIEIRELISELGKDHTVILSSHILSEVQAICEKVLIINKGKLIAFDKPENLEKHFKGQNSIELACDETLEEVQDLLKDIASITSIIKENDKYILNIDSEPAEITKQIFKAFSSQDKVIYQMNPKKISLEDVFIELTQDENKEEELQDVGNL